MNRDRHFFRSVASIVLMGALFLALGSVAGPVRASAPAVPVMGGTDGLPGVRYLHVATDENTTGNVTYLRHPLLDGDPNAIFFVTHSFNPGGGYSGVINEHHLGVYYNSSEQRWAIFNQDGTTMGVGSHYNVLIPKAGTGVFVHEATSGNTVSHFTIIDHPLLNDNPDALLLITPNWNPGGGIGVYNDRPIGVWYSNTRDKWSIFNQDFISMPSGAAFNVLVIESGAEAFVHQATVDNSTTGATIIDDPAIDGDPHALVFITQSWNPGGIGGVYNPYHVAVGYNTLYDQWYISNLEPGMGVDITRGASFNVLVVRAPSPWFTHQATASDTPGDHTQLSHPMLDGEPNAVAFVTQNWNPGGVGGIYNDHPVGLWYADGGAEWNVLNQDGMDVPLGAGFNVHVPNMDAGVFVHWTTVSNTLTNATYLSTPLLDDDPNAIFFVTPNWNPGGGATGFYNPHPEGVGYDPIRGQWAILNEDSAAMAVGPAFNVFVPRPGANVFVHEATAGNVSLNSTFLDHPLLNGNPDAQILITQNWNPNGEGLAGTYNPHNVGVWYSNLSDRWGIFNQDGDPMPLDAAFNVYVEPVRVYLPLVLSGS